MLATAASSNVKAWLDTTALQALHPDSDKFVLIANDREDKRLAHRIMVSAARLKHGIPRDSQDYSRNSYCSVNEYCGLFSKSMDGSFRAMHKGGSHAVKKNISRLMACHCDVDLRNVHKSVEEGRREIDRAIVSKAIPRPSVVSYSGTGLWLFYRLLIPPAVTYNSPEVTQCEAVNKALAHRLAHLGADLGAADITRLTRIPGSFRPDLRMVVEWKYAAPGDMPLYTLDELAVFLGIAEAPSDVEESFTAIGTPKGQRTLPQMKSTGRGKEHHRLGHVNSYQRHLDVFCLVWRLRGTFQYGVRANAVMYYTAHLRNVGTSRTEVTSLVLKLARTSLGRDGRPYRAKSALSQIASIFKDPTGYRRLGFQGMADALKITIEEAVKIRATFKNKFPASQRYAVPVPQPKKGIRGSTCNRRRAAIVEFQEQMGGLPPLREIELFLLQKGFKTAAPNTIRKDCKELGIRAGTLTRPQAANVSEQSAKVG